MTRTKNYLSKKSFIALLGTTSLHVSCCPVHCERKIFFRFFEVFTYPSIHYFRLEASPCNTISEGRPPLSNTSSEAGVLPIEVRIENDSDRKLSKSKLFYRFLETTFLQVSCYPVYCELKIFFGFLESEPS